MWEGAVRRVSGLSAPLLLDKGCETKSHYECFRLSCFLGIIMVVVLVEWNSRRTFPRADLRVRLSDAVLGHVQSRIACLFGGTLHTYFYVFGRLGFFPACWNGPSCRKDALLLQSQRVHLVWHGPTYLPLQPLTTTTELVTPLWPSNTKHTRRTRRLSLLLRGSLRHE